MRERGGDLSLPLANGTAAKRKLAVPDKPLPNVQKVSNADFVRPRSVLQQHDGLIVPLRPGTILAARFPHLVKGAVLETPSLAPSTRVRELGILQITESGTPPIMREEGNSYLVMEGRLDVTKGIRQGAGGSREARHFPVSHECGKPA